MELVNFFTQEGLSVAHRAAFQKVFPCIALQGSPKAQRLLVVVKRLARGIFYEGIDCTFKERKSRLGEHAAMEDATWPDGVAAKTFRYHTFISNGNGLDSTSSQSQSGVD